LPELEQVMAFHSAPAHHGGTGAVYLLLRKSEQARQENREKHQRRA
jgi:DNA-nicking Smr family endonuclease